MKRNEDHSDQSSSSNSEESSSLSLHSTAIRRDRMAATSLPEVSLFSCSRCASTFRKLNPCRMACSRSQRPSLAGAGCGLGAELGAPTPPPEGGGGAESIKDGGGGPGGGGGGGGGGGPPPAGIGGGGGGETADIAVETGGAGGEG